ncbi:MAG: hypothetical protein KC535_00215 [Nanoarchaeota archaeon]|nr:hypothetical protein [Nanoarchaeota archaeon]
MKINTLKLQAKGWSEEEIEHAKQVLQEAENKKHPRIILLEKALYWILLLISFLGAVMGTWLIEPFLIFMSTGGAVIIIFIIGIIFGSIASILMKDVENLELHHHLILSMIIPVSAIVTSILITNQANKVSQLINIGTQHQPAVLGIVYSIGSLIPFAILLWYERREEDGTF